MTGKRLVLAGVAVAFAGVLLVAVLGTRYVLTWLHTPLSVLEAPVSYEIPRGANINIVARDLETRGYIGHPRFFVAWARLTGQAEGIKAGEYELMPGTSPQGLLDLFVSGRVLLHAITFIEGTTFADILRQLREHPHVTQEVADLDAKTIMARLGFPDTHPEGWFFPDTYRFPKQTSDLVLLRMAHERMQRELEAVWATRASDLPLERPYEALILASIIEKETGLDRERAQISGVFVQRLRRSMRLQTDPTVIYGVGEDYDGNLRRADLRRDTPYNTYTRAGLPPTPIALPGRASLQAAVQPDETGALFFVATGLGDGSHHFSRTLAEHEAAVQRYLARLREQQP